MSSKYRYIIISVTIVSFALVSFVMINMSENVSESLLFRALKHKDGVSSLRLPNELFFAGERVPLENFDTRESLERELVVNTYWHSQTILLMKRSKRYFPVIDSILTENNIPSDFKYLAMAESGLMNVTSPANAVGFWQFLAGTARDYGLEINDEVDERYHLEKATVAACKYLQESYNKYGSWTLAAASYNAGRRFLSNQMEQQQQNIYYDLLLGEEAGRYVFRILALKLVMETPTDYGFVLAGDGYKAVPFYLEKVDSTVIDFSMFAIERKTNYKMLKMLNPWLRKPHLNVYNNKEYFIKVPVDGFRMVETVQEDSMKVEADGIIK